MPNKKGHFTENIDTIQIINWKVTEMQTKKENEGETEMEEERE